MNAAASVGHAPLRCTSGSNLGGESVRDLQESVGRKLNITCIIVFSLVCYRLAQRVRVSVKVGQVILLVKARAKSPGNECESMPCPPKSWVPRCQSGKMCI